MPKHKPPRKPNKVVAVEEYRPLRDWHPKKGDEFETPWGETVHVRGFNTYKYGKGWYVTQYDIRFIGPKGHEIELETEGLAKVRKKPRS